MKPGNKIPGDQDRFTDFARRILLVPRSEIVAKLEAEKAAKRTPNPVSLQANKFAYNSAFPAHNRS
jgi:hypothetical protein